MFYQKKHSLENASTTKRSEYSSLGSALKKQAEIAKDQGKFLIDQINVNNNNNEDNIVIEDGDNREEDMSGESSILKSLMQY